MAYYWWETMNMRNKGTGTVQKKILLLLNAGFSLLTSGMPDRQFRILEQLGDEWEKINQDHLRRAIKSLYKSKLVDFQLLPDGRFALTLLDDGKKKVLSYNIDKMNIAKPKQWDGKWRMVLFDIPKYMKKTREAFRFHLKRLGFYQFQKSIFIHPYPCDGEIEFLIEFHNIRPYVRCAEITRVDNDLDLRDRFKLM